MKQTDHPNRDISPITNRHVWSARCREFSFVGGLIAFNLWGEGFCILPSIKHEPNAPWWDLEGGIKRVAITRLYWLKFGVAYIRKVME